MAEVYFKDIKDVIVDYLDDSQESIEVCVAWLTDPDIYDVLCQKAEEGVEVTLILHTDEINTKYACEHDRLIESGGKIFWGDHHHKFCIIDHDLIITGSYNWTKAANNRGNGENIVVIKEDFNNVEEFMATFNVLLNESAEHGSFSMDFDEEEDEEEEDVDENYDDDDDEDDDEDVDDKDEGDDVSQIAFDDKPLIEGAEEELLQKKWAGKTLGELWVKEKIVTAKWFSYHNSYILWIELPDKITGVKFVFSFTLHLLERDLRYYEDIWDACRDDDSAKNIADLKNRIESFKKELKVRGKQDLLKYKFDFGCIKRPYESVEYHRVFFRLYEPHDKPIRKD